MKLATRIGLRSVESLLPYANNARTHSASQVAEIAASIREFGFNNPVLIDDDSEIIAGHGRVLAAKHLGMEEVPTITINHLSDAQKRAFAIADNRIALNAGWDEEMLRIELQALAESEFDVNLLGFTPEEIAIFTDATGGNDSSKAADAARVTLAERFLIPPFSVLDSRQGIWQDRKRAWLSLGLDSSAGRGSELLYSTKGTSDIAQRIGKIGGTSVFDPVLCEIAYRWFAPKGGKVLDPFAGGSVRGVVAAKLGLNYTGVDLRPEQVEANRANWNSIDQGSISQEQAPDYMPDLTPIERRGEYWIKRDDLFTVAGVAGGKARSCWHLAQRAAGLVTAGSRASPQANIVAHIADRLGIPCRVHTPGGELSPELVEAQAAGATVVQHKAGYNNVIIARARDDAKVSGYANIPFGMECLEAVKQTAAQVRDIPPEVTRIVMPVGSGMSLAGVLTGLKAIGWPGQVVGVVVGADPEKRLSKFAPKEWRDMVTLIPSGSDYHAAAPITELEGIALDPHYEAKCLPFLKPGDMLWIVGIRQTARRGDATSNVAIATPNVAPRWITGDSKGIDKLAPGEYDLVFTCPPYADLEVYSDDPRDISNMDYPGFVQAYKEIIKKSVELLKPNRFAVFVVGEVRGKSGAYLGFVTDTILAFEDAGCQLYNEAVLITMVGSLPLRAANGFVASRKLGKTHQNVLVFQKGEAVATQAELTEPDITIAAGGQFVTTRQLLEKHDQVLIFIKGDARVATGECGPVEIANDEIEIQAQVYAEN